MLTDTQCRNAKPKDKSYKLTDTKGLYLEVKPNRVKSWRYRFELVRNGVRKESVFAIGDYASPPSDETKEQAEARRAGGSFTLAEARDERAKARALVKQGINPAQNRQLDRIRRGLDAANTVQAVAEEWIALRDWEDITKKRRLDMLRRVVFPKIGKMPVRDVKPANVLDLLKTAETKNGVSVAHEAKRTLSAIFEHAVATLRADADPVYPVRRALPPNKTQHKQALSQKDVGELLRALDGYERNYQTVAVIRLMWLTLCRPNEVVSAEWAHIDLDAAVWRIPPQNMKKRREHVVPLPRQAVELLRAMHGHTGHRRYVFPHRDNRDEPMTYHTMRMALHYLGWSSKYSPHATRTTGSTHLNGMGFNSDWIERQLAHLEQNAVRRTYNHADYLEQRRGMMQQWADTLDAWKAGGKVLPLKASAA